ncbi:MAG: hypothetical protein VX733_09900 [Candidatus Latescibacterota bacterium]|nr:hypothetical protein [Candidatus Latescibacterota bacterium]
MADAPNKIEFYKSGLRKYAHQDFASARDDFIAALELDANFGDVHHSLAHAYEKLAEYDLALASALRAVESAPEDPLTHTTLSVMYQRKGMIPEAEAEMARANELSVKA